MRQKPVTLQARVIHFLDPHAREAGAESGRRATMLVGLGASLAGSVLFAIAVYGVCSLSIFQAGFSGWRPEFLPLAPCPPGNTYRVAQPRASYSITLRLRSRRLPDRRRCLRRAP